MGSDLPKGTQPENHANPLVPRLAHKLCDRPEKAEELLARGLESASGAPVDRFGVLTDPGFGPDSHPQGLTLLV